MYGYHGRILHVNLTNGQTHIETFDETFAQTYLGGNGFAIRLLYERLAPGIDPLAPDNMLVFAVGPATDKCLSKINFILIAKSLDDPFNILNQG